MNDLGLNEDDPIFEVGGKKHKVTDVSDDDKKAAEEI